MPHQSNIRFVWFASYQSLSAALQLCLSQTLYAAESAPAETVAASKARGKSASSLRRPVFAPLLAPRHILCARLREASHDAAFGSLQEIRRIVTHIRAAWPEVKITLPGDSGFFRNELMSCCETQGVDFVLSMARNQRLRRIIGAPMHAATQQWN